MGAWLKYLLSSVYIGCLVIDSVFCDWSYVDTSRWGKTWKDCTGMHQSPVNIIDSEAATLPSPVVLSFENFDKPLEVYLSNNGKTAKLAMPSGKNISVSGNGLNIRTRYNLEEVHFHWRTRTSGSEHKIDGKHASMEVHLVHYNIKYESFKTARKEHDGVLVLSVLVDVSTNVSLNSFWNDFSDKLSLVRVPESKKKLGNVKFSNFLPKDRDNFYFYQGSFTTPPCSETVTWLVFKERLQIPSEYLDRFRALRTSTNGSLVTLASNTRPVKPLNSRTVLKTFESPGRKDFENHVIENVLQGVDVIGVLRIYQCHIPTSVSLSVIIPALDIAWKSLNLTSDIPTRVPLDATKEYGVALEMHDHPNKHAMHFTVKLDGSDLINKKYDIKKDCLKDSCTWLSVGKSMTCTRRLIDTDKELSFTLTRQDRCDDAYEITIKKNDATIFETTMKPKTRVKVLPRTDDGELRHTLSRWYLLLHIHTTNNTSHTKLFLDIPYSLVLSSSGFLMEGLYHSCNSSPSGTPVHVKVIVGVTVGVFILVMIILTVCLVWKTHRSTPKSRSAALIEEDEPDTAV